MHLQADTHTHINTLIPAILPTNLSTKLATLRNKRIVVVLDGWDRFSHYPSGLLAGGNIQQEGDFGSQQKDRVWFHFFSRIIECVTDGVNTDQLVKDSLRLLTLLVANCPACK